MHQRGEGDARLIQREGGADQRRQVAETDAAVGRIEEHRQCLRGVQDRKGHGAPQKRDRKSTRLNSSHSQISYAVFCLKKKKNEVKTSPNIKRLNSRRRQIPETS